MSQDFCKICLEKLPNYEEKIKSFNEEHLHMDEEIRYCVAGSGYLWIRISVKKGALIILPAGIYHHFTLDPDNYIMELKKSESAIRWRSKMGPSPKRSKDESTSSMSITTVTPPLCSSASSRGAHSKSRNDNAVWSCWNGLLLPNGGLMHYKSIINQWMNK